MITDRESQIDIILDVIGRKDKPAVRHQHYERVVKLAELYRKLATGENLDDLLQQIVTRESDEAFAQRVKITKHVCPSILASTRLFFQKVSRSRPLKNELIPKETGTADSMEALSAVINRYTAEKSLDQFLEEVKVALNYIDPNAWLITEFVTSDDGVVAPYTWIAYSQQAVDFSYDDNGNLQYLVVMQDYNEKEKKYFGYFGEMAMTFTPLEDVAFTIPEWKISEVVYDGEYIQVYRKGDTFFRIDEYEMGASVVPAIRPGYIYDDVTNRETYVSVFHMTVPLLEKTLKVNSELDFSMAAMAFPQRFAYVPNCTDPNCVKGTNQTTNQPCSVCGGTGKQKVHTTAMDTVEVALPDNKEEMYDLEKMLAYKSPPIDLLKFDDDYLDKLKVSVHKTMFNADLFTRTQVSETATEKNLERDNLDDTLYPFARRYQQVRIFITELIAEYMKAPLYEVAFVMPTRFNLRTLGELMSDLQIAKNAGASQTTLAAIEDDINSILYADRPEELKRIQVKQFFNPFRGNTTEQAAVVIANNRTTKYNAILYSNLESIFSELEAENYKPWLYDMEYALIKQKLDVKVAEYIARIEAEKPAPVIPFGMLNESNVE